jgi:hypothetical protein
VKIELDSEGKSKRGVGGRRKKLVLRTNRRKRQAHDGELLNL